MFLLFLIPVPSAWWMLGHSAADSHQCAMRLPIQYGVCSPVRGKPRTEYQVQGVPITHRLEIQLHNHSPPVQPRHEYCCSLKSRQAEYAAFPVPEGYIVPAAGYDFAIAKSVQPATPARTLRLGQLSLLIERWTKIWCFPSHWAAVFCIESIWKSAENIKSKCITTPSKILVFEKKCCTCFSLCEISVWIIA